MDHQGKLRIAVVGAGAVGSLLGGLLAKAGYDVTLIGRPAHVEKISKGGLQIDGISGDFTVFVHTAPTLTFNPEIVLLTVKMQDLEATCRQIAPLVQDVPVCTLQNGIRSDEVAGNLLGKRNIVGGVVLFNAYYTHPGHVTHGSKGALLLGNAFDGDEKRLHRLHALFNQVVPTNISDTIADVRNTKLLVNILGNSMDALTGMSLRDCMKSRSMCNIATNILKEALMVLEKDGVRFASIPGIPAPLFITIIKLPLPLASRLLQRITSKITTVSSTLQSLQRGRPTEIAYLNGEIVSLGKKMNIPTPYNLMVVESIRTIEKTGTFYSFDQVARLIENR